MPFPYTFPFFFDSPRHSIDAALKVLGLSTGFGVECLIAILSTKSSDFNIDTLLKTLSVSELYELDVALQKLDFESSYHAGVLLVLRNRVSFQIGVLISIIPSVPAIFSIGVYLASPQKFDLAVSFEQFMANPTFETLEVTPYFQEV